MAPTTKLLLGAIILLMIDGFIETAFIANTVSWLHTRAGKAFIVNHDGSTFPLHGTPANELADQGHASNGAAGTAYVVVGFGGFLALWLRQRQLKTSHELRGFTKGFYNFWCGLTVVAAVFDLACVVYVFVLTYRHMQQHIDVAFAATLDSHPYPRQQWTPENWCTALLELPLAHGSDRSDIETQLMIMKGWRWNTIPLFVLGALVAVLAIVDRMALRRRVSGGMHMPLDKASRLEAGSPEL